jgi:hypothetical protein
MRYPGESGHHVEAVPHAIDKVDIGMAGRTEHNLVASGAASGGMGGEILRPLVGLGLDDLPDLAVASAGTRRAYVDQVHADELTGYDQRAASVEGARKFGA